MIQEEIDFKYCNGPCKFLNFLHIQEQGTIHTLIKNCLKFSSMQQKI